MSCGRHYVDIIPYQAYIANHNKCDGATAAMTRYINYAAIAMITIFLGACCTQPWNRFPQLKRPDTSYRTGHSHGYDLYIWECREGKRMVVYRHAGGMTCSEPVLETAPCGGQTPIEKKLASEEKRLVPDQQKWPD